MHIFCNKLPTPAISYSCYHNSYFTLILQCSLYSGVSPKPVKINLNNRCGGFSTYAFEFQSDLENRYDTFYSPNISERIANVPKNMQHEILRGTILCQMYERHVILLSKCCIFLGTPVIHIHILIDRHLGERTIESHCWYWHICMYNIVHKYIATKILLRMKSKH